MSVDRSLGHSQRPLGGDAAPSDEAPRNLAAGRGSERYENDASKFFQHPAGSAVRPPLLLKLVRTVRQQGLFIPGQHLLVGVSGGPDSIALLSLLHHMIRSWRLTLTVVHCNFGLRGEESDSDESFVDTFCRERQLPLVVHRPVMAKRQQRSSFQAAARAARYDFMKQLAHEVGADCIAVGHTANDQVETVLMWLLRGAGMTGLAGMPYARDRIIRPLLAATRKEVLTYLDDEGLTYRHDSSNEKPLYHRNRIRKELLPVITRLAPAAIRVLLRQSDLLREDEQYLEHMTSTLVRTLVNHGFGDVQRVDRRAFIELPIALQRRLVRSVLRTYDEEGRASSFRAVESVRRFFLKGRNGARLSLKHTLVDIEQRSVRFSPGVGRDHEMGTDSRSDKRERLPLPMPSTVYWTRTNQQIQVQLIARRAVEEVCGTPSQGLAWFDADRFSEPLLVRAWQTGDRFFPYGMKGKSKKLQDFFTDRKVARQEREMIPLLVAPEGILWVVGMQQDERFVVRDGTTRCLVVSINNRVSKGSK
jgi:tRNA(Ile)-lysidine synthase